jgi:cell division protein ZapA (FtsZ GTPase activity inhibitor)
LDQFVTIELFGQPYTFKAETEAAKAKEVADFLVGEVNKIQDQQAAQIAHIPKLTILIITALNMAHQILQLKKDAGEIVGHISNRCEELNRMLDEGLKPFASLRHYG